MIAVIIVDIWPFVPVLQGGLAILVAVLHGLRLSGWRSLRTRGDPMLWVLHLAYAWLPLGFALKGLTLLGNAAWGQHWQHAFGIGAIATMILAVSTRTALGHTGRPLLVGRPIVAAYLLLALAGALRVAGPRVLAGQLFRRTARDGLQLGVGFSDLHRGVWTNPGQPAGGWETRVNSWRRQPSMQISQSC
jgi:uncharacterized protein involved in response to NO